MPRVMDDFQQRERRARTRARARAYQDRLRDDLGRFARDREDAPRVVMISIRVTEGERAMIFDAAAATDRTVTALIVETVRQLQLPRVGTPARARTAPDLMR